jgi:hypothetical protein
MCDRSQSLRILSGSGTPSSPFRLSLPFGWPTRNQSRLKERSPQLLVLQLAGKTSGWLKSRTSLSWRLICLIFRKNISVEDSWNVIACIQIESSTSVLRTAYDRRQHKSMKFVAQSSTSTHCLHFSEAARH